MAALTVVILVVDLPQLLDPCIQLQVWVLIDLLFQVQELTAAVMDGYSSIVGPLSLTNCKWSNLWQCMKGLDVGAEQCNESTDDQKWKGWMGKQAGRSYLNLTSLVQIGTHSMMSFVPFGSKLDCS